MRADAFTEGADCFLDSFTNKKKKEESFSPLALSC